MTIKLGYVKSQADPKDYIYSQMFYGNTTLPRKFLYPKIKINNQIIGSCVGETMRSTKVLQELKNHPISNYDFSPDHGYAECKKIDGIPHIEGTYLKTAAAILKNIGIAEKGLYPTLTDWRSIPEPSEAARKSASKFKIGAYAKVQTVNEIKTALVNEGPVMAGLLITDYMAYDSEGFWCEPYGYMVGGHAVTIDGYDDDMVRTFNGKTYKGFFRFINSWGDNWGQNGYGWISYDLVNFRSDLGMAFFEEAWTSVDVIMPDDNVKFMTLWVGSKRAIVDGKEYIMDQAPINHNGRVMVPIRFIQERQGFKVTWDDNEKRVDIYK